MAERVYRVSRAPNNHEDPRLAEILDVIFKFAAGDLTARGRLSGDDSALDGVMAGINILGEELEARLAENKRAQRALSESEDQLRAIFDAVQDGIILAEAQSRRFLMVNAAICRMLGYSPEELLKLEAEDILPEEERAYGLSQYERLAKDEIGVAPNVPMKRKDGTVFYVDINAGSMAINGVACLVGVFRDITERLQAQQALSESEALLRTIFDTVQEGIILADAQTLQFHMANDSICRMLGYSRDELLNLGVEDIHPENDTPGVVRQIERQIKREISIAPNLPVKRKDGTIFYADVNSTPMQVRGASFLLGVFRDITERKRAEQAEELARRDGLTGLYNHRTFQALLKDEIARTQRFNRPVSLLMLDIDHFKRINDTYGHQAGDVILKGLSDLLLKQARAVDRVCRYGGEEFTLILPETDLAEAMQIAERLRAAVEREPFDIDDGKAIGIAVSIGVAAYSQQANSPQALIHAADSALYAAKQSGRNRVCSHEIGQTHRDD